MKKIMLCLMSVLLLVSFVGCAEKGERKDLGSISILQPESFEMSHYPPAGGDEGKLYTSGSINSVPSYQIYVANTITHGEYPMTKDVAAAYIKESVGAVDEVNGFPLSEYQVGKDIAGFTQTWALTDRDGKLKEVRFVVFNTPESTVKFTLIETGEGLKDLDSKDIFEGMLESVRVTED